VEVGKYSGGEKGKTHKKEGRWREYRGQGKSETSRAIEYRGGKERRGKMYEVSTMNGMRGRQVQRKRKSGQNEQCE
jgi:hypothetical protein